MKNSHIIKSINSTSNSDWEIELDSLKSIEDGEDSDDWEMGLLYSLDSREDGEDSGIAFVDNSKIFEIQDASLERYNLTDYRHASSNATV